MPDAGAPDADSIKFIQIYRRVAGGGSVGADSTFEEMEQLTLWRGSIWSGGQNVHREGDTGAGATQPR